MNKEENQYLMDYTEGKAKQLKKCPFCGGNPEIKNTWTLCHWVECINCDAQVKDPQGDCKDGTEEEHRNSIERACKAWNNRVKVAASLLLCFLMSSCGGNQVVVWTISDIASAIIWGIIILIVVVLLAYLGILELWIWIQKKWKKKKKTKPTNNGTIN